jgi:ribose transport system permease protein
MSGTEGHVSATQTAARQARAVTTVLRRIDLRTQIQQLLAFAGLVVLFLFFSLVSDDFMEWTNISSILLSTAVIGILALGTTFVIISGGIDLSTGTGMTLCAVMTGIFLTNMQMPLLVGVIGGIVTGALIGLVNGFNVAVLQIPPFIATLAMMMVAQGLALVISGTQPIYFTDVGGFIDIALGETVPGLPNAALVLFIMALVGGLVLAKTLLGRYVFAIGSNEEATEISGIRVRRWKILVYTFAGVFTGVAGVVLAARLNSAQPSLGMGYELQAIAAVVIGGSSLAGGRATIVGTFLGVVTFALIFNLLTLMDVAVEIQQIIQGLIILAAVLLQRRR